MQRVPNFPTDLTVAEPSFRVMVNGVQVDAESVTVARELSTSLPAQVVSASGIAAATGSVSLALGDIVSSHVAHPWEGGGIVPKPADVVTVDAGYGTAMARQLSGIIDSTSGSLDGSISSNVVDYIDKLSRPVTLEPHMSVRPPYAEGGDFLLCNNSPMFTTDRVLRACGFNATPPLAQGAVLSVPLMGSAWPELGKLTSASQVGFPTFPPSFSQTQWGLGANSISAQYEPAYPATGTNRLNKTLQVTVKARTATGSGGNTVLRVWWGSVMVSLELTSSRELVGSIYSGSSSEVCRMPAVTAQSADVFTMRVTSSGVFTIYANNGANVTGTGSLPASMATTDMTHVQIVSTHLSGIHIGGVQVGFSTDRTWESPCTAVLTPSASNLGLQAVPGIRGRIALEVLKEQAEAECAAMWIDEFGVFRWVNRNILTSANPVETLTALDDVLDIGWDSDAKGVRAGVDVKSRNAKITRFPVSSVTLYRGSGEALQSNTSTTDIVEPGADETWFNMETSASGWTRQQLNRGEMSMVGGIVSKDDTADVWAADVGKLTYTLEPINSESLAITHTAGNLGAGETVVLKTSESDLFIKPFRRDKPLPLIRGKGRVRWADIVTTGATTGPATSARLEHEAGFWVQDPLALQELANWLSAQVSAPRPVLSNLSVIPDPRRQLTDIVWVEDPENMRIRLKVMITSLSLTVSDGSMDQTIGGRILEVQSYGPTNQRLDQHAAPFTNSGFDTLWSGVSNAQFDTNPLGRG